MSLSLAKILFGAAALAAVGAAAYALFFKPPVSLFSPGKSGSFFPETGDSVTTSPEGSAATTTASGKKKTLPPEPVFVLPEGAAAIDDYVFVQKNEVHFRSLTGTSSLAIPDADPDTFKRVADFITYPGEAIQQECGAAGTYTYYKDKSRVYFYQFWRAPKFRSSKIEVLADVLPSEFAVEDMTHARAGDQRMQVEYKVATSTCSFILARI